MATEKTKKVKTTTKTAKIAAKAVVKKTTSTKTAATAKPKAKAEVKVAKAVRTDGSTVVSLASPSGKSEKTTTLPQTIFGDKVNKQLLAQAVRVYLANQREGGAHSKTRGEVEGSSKKIYKQKGTGKARHGTIRAPIFVKGGVALGPRTHDFHLDLPKKMRLKALSSALSSQVAHNNVAVIADIASVEKKTKAFASMFKALSMDRKTLLVIGSKEQEVVKLVRNIPFVTVLSAREVYAYAVLMQKNVCVTQSAVGELEARFKGENTL